MREDFRQDQLGIGHARTSALGQRLQATLVDVQWRESGTDAFFSSNAGDGVGQAIQGAGSEPSIEDEEMVVTVARGGGHRGGDRHGEAGKEAFIRVGDDVEDRALGHGLGTR